MNGKGLKASTIVRNLDAWLQQIGIKAKRVWLARNAEGRPNGQGYLVFGNHEDAKTALKLDCSSLLDQMIMVVPSLLEELEVTQNVVSLDGNKKPIIFCKALIDCSLVSA